MLEQMQPFALCSVGHLHVDGEGCGEIEKVTIVSTTGHTTKWKILVWLKPEEERLLKSLAEYAKGEKNEADKGEKNKVRLPNPDMMISYIAPEVSELKPIGDEKGGDLTVSRSLEIPVMALGRQERFAMRKIPFKRIRLHGVTVIRLFSITIQ
jgi:hypothetical protein